MNFIKTGSSKNYLVFLHGWGADLNSFLFMHDYFCDYSKIFVDFAGFGKTAEPKRPYFVDDYVNELFDLLKQFDIENLILVGHSFGGRVAIKFASKFQNNFNNFKICLIDSAGIKPRLTLKKRWQIFVYKRLKKKSIKNEKIRQKLNKFGSSDYKKLSKLMKQTFVNVVNEDLSTYAKKITCNCLIVWGSKDKETKLYTARKLNKLIVNSKLQIIKNAGHFSFLENKQEFLIILDTFIKNQ